MQNIRGKVVPLRQKPDLNGSFFVFDGKFIQRALGHAAVARGGLQRLFRAHALFHVMVDMLDLGQGVERVLLCARALYEQDVFPALFAGEPLGKPEIFHALVQFGDLAHGARLARAEHLGEQLYVAVHILRGAVKEQRAAKIGISLQKGAFFRGLSAQKAQKSEGICREAGENERGDEGARAGDEGVCDARLAQGLHEQVAGVGDDGGARVRHHGDVFALLCQRDEFFRGGEFIEFMAGNERLFYLVIVEKFEGMAGILAEYDVRLPQGIQRAQGDIP